MQPIIGSIYDGTVTGIVAFGAFISLGEGVSGLCHISEISTAYVKDIKEHLSIGDKVRVKALSIDDKGKVSLSIKKAAEEEGEIIAKRPAVVEFTGKSSATLSFEEKIKLFMQDSDEKMHDIKKGEKKRTNSFKRNART